MARFDLLDEYTCVLVPQQTRREASRDAAPPAFRAANRRGNLRWGHWMASAGGFAALVIAVMGSRLSG